MLDAVLLSYSCRVKNPHQAIRSKLNGQNIIDVKEEDLIHFSNLSHLDISDNQVLLSQLVNLCNLEELDIQYNNLSFLAINSDNFPKLQTLKLSYNKIPPSHIIELGNLVSLRCLEMASNDLCTLPSTMSFLPNLQELNLSGNNFNSESVLVKPHELFLALGTLPSLQMLNLSRNKFKGFHHESVAESDEPLFT